jgi:hypothetical protein
MREAIIGSAIYGFIKSNKIQERCREYIYIYIFQHHRKIPVTTTVQTITGEINQTAGRHVIKGRCISYKCYIASTVLREIL